MNSTADVVYRTYSGMSYRLSYMFCSNVRSASGKMVCFGMIEILSLGL